MTIAALRGYAVFRTSAHPQKVKLAKLFARPNQTLQCDMQAPIAAGPTPSLTQETPSELNMFPDLIFVKGNPDQKHVDKTSFVQRTSLLLEVTRHNQNRLMFFVFSLFIGLVVFTRICTPLFALTDQMQFGVFAPPQLAGEWVLNDVTDTPAAPHNLRFTVAQHNFDLTAKGSDEFGEFDLVGKLIPPNKIHLVKIHNNAQLHDIQILDGELALDSVPLYAHGGWTRAHAIDATKENLQTDGYWDANFYSTKPQPKFMREGILRSPKALMEFLRYGKVSEPNQPSKEAPDGQE